MKIQLIAALISVFLCGELAAQNNNTTRLTNSYNLIVTARHMSPYLQLYKRQARPTYTLYGSDYLSKAGVFSYPTAKQLAQKTYFMAPVFGPRPGLPYYVYTIYDNKNITQCIVKASHHHHHRQ